MDTGAGLFAPHWDGTQPLYLPMHLHLCVNRAAFLCHLHVDFGVPGVGRDLPSLGPGRSGSVGATVWGPVRGGPTFYLVPALRRESPCIPGTLPRGV